MKNAKDLEITSRLVNLLLSKETKIIESNNKTLNTSFTIKKDVEFLNKTKTISNNLIQSIYIDKIFFKSDLELYVKSFEINKLVHIDINRYESIKCHISSTLTEFSKNNVRTDKVKNFGSYNSRDKKNQFKSFDKLGEELEIHIKEFYISIGTTKEKIDIIEDNIVFLWDMFICEYIRSPSVFFTFPMCLKIAFYAIQNTDNETVKKLFNKKNCVELVFTSKLYEEKLENYNKKLVNYNTQLVNYNAQLENSSNIEKPKKPKGIVSIKKLKERIEFIEEDFTTMENYLTNIDNTTINSKIIRHIFNYFFPMSIKEAVSGMRIINEKFYPEYNFDRETSEKPYSPHKAKIIFSITEVLCRFYKKLFPDTNYMNITDEFFGIKIDYTNYECVSNNVIDNYTTKIAADSSSFFEEFDLN